MARKLTFVDQCTEFHPFDEQHTTYQISETEFNLLAHLIESGELGSIVDELKELEEDVEGIRLQLNEDDVHQVDATEALLALSHTVDILKEAVLQLQSEKISDLLKESETRSQQIADLMFGRDNND